MSVKASCGIDRRTAVTRSYMAFTFAKHATLMAGFLCQHLSHFVDHFWDSVVSIPSRKRKHIYCSRLRSRRHASAFHASLLQFSPICSRTVCTFASLHCHTTSHTDYVQLASARYIASRMQSMLYVDSPYVSEEPCVRAHTFAKFPIRYDTIHRTF